MKFRMVLGFFVAATFFTHSAQASSKEFRVSVPFAFTAYDKLMPAGEYRVAMVSDRVVTLRRADGSTIYVSSLASVESPNQPSRGKLVFARVGSQYVLAEVWGHQSCIGQLLRQAPPMSHIAMNSAEDNTVLVPTSK